MCVDSIVFLVYIIALSFLFSFIILVYSPVTIKSIVIYIYIYNTRLFNFTDQKKDEIKKEKEKIIE